MVGKMRSIYDFVPAPIARWSMNDNADSAIVIDELGNHNGTYHGTGGTDDYTSAHSVAGKVNTALDFDGVQDYIEIADHADFTPALTPFSISAWIYMHNPRNFFIATKCELTTIAEWMFYVSSGRKLTGLFYGANVNIWIGRYYNTTMQGLENQWLHIAFTYDGGIVSSGIKLYLNGLRVDDSTMEYGTFATVKNLASPVMLGKRTNDYADGLIDHVMIFNKELTARQVKKLHDFLRGKESIYGPRPNRIYHRNINSGIFGG